MKSATYINFQGKARQAMEHYHAALGGELQLFAAGRHQQPKPAEPGDSIMHAKLEVDGVLIIASDGSPQFPAKVGENMAISLSGSDEAQMRKVFDALVAGGGKVKMPLTKMPWGTAGWLEDPFGISWNIDVEASGS